MPYTVYNESLIKYVLRHPVTGVYHHNNKSCGTVGVFLEKADIFNTIREAEQERERISDIYPELKDLQIRKIKIIDIGEV